MSSRSVSAWLAPVVVVFLLIGFVLYVVIDAAGEEKPPPSRPVASVGSFVESFSEPLDESWRLHGPVVADVGGDQHDGAVALRAPAGALGGSGELVHQLPEPPWALSFDLRIDPGTRARILLGKGPRTLRIRSLPNGVEVAMGARRATIAAQPGWPPDGWHHVEIAGGRQLQLTVDGGRLTLSVPARRTLGLGADGGVVRFDNVLASPLRDARGLLLHRVASLRARTPPGSFPLGTGRDGVLHLADGWTTGFWPGALWQAADLTAESDLFADWALEATMENLGDERADTHDLGFKYELSSVAAYRRVCQGPDQGRDEYERADEATCDRLRDSGLEAADSLLRLARTSRRARTLPTRSGPGCTGCRSDSERDTIIDSAMNLPLLFWAGRVTGRERYRRVAQRAARRLAELLVRRDGSTGQSVHFDRRTGRVVRRHTHQGLSADSTWARGQGWALYGFTELAAQLADRRLLKVAERTAAYVEGKLPADGIPRYDYEAPESAPADTSAGVIGAAGLLRLGAVCRGMGTCAETERWTLIGRRMLRSALGAVETEPTLGYFGHQVQTLGGRNSWDDDGELIFGLYYALEAIRVADAGGS